jgi:predicted metalloprotease with PDZ domain
LRAVEEAGGPTGPIPLSIRRPDLRYTGARSALAIVWLLLLLVPTARAALTGTVKYSVSVADLEDKRFRIAVTVEAGDSQAVRFAIPAWTPGYYQILNFHKDITNVRAADSRGRVLSVTQPDERSWQIDRTSTGPVTLTYEVSARDAGFGFFGSQLEAVSRTGYINGASALMYVVGGKELPATVAVRLPEGWEVSTSLDPAGQPNAFKAANYDELIDCPIQMGAFERLDFDVKGTPFAAILVGAKNPDRSSITEMLKGVSASALDLIGSAPFKRYHYIFHFRQGSFSGGLEHRNSTVLNVSPGSAAQPRSLTELVAHEYFHAWNVKRIRPAVLGPFDYTQKVRTGALWFSEGVTDYYALVLPRMAGLLSEEGFLQGIAGTLRGMQRNEARKKISAEEASMKAWEGGSMGFGGLSYYDKGRLLGFLFDIKIRAATDGAKSLDDVMRLLDDRYGRYDRGFEEDGILRAINDVSGKDLTEFYARYVRTTEEIPWNDMLREVGLVYQEGDNKSPYLGISTPRTKGNVLVEMVVPDSAAATAGLKAGDEILSLNGATVSAEGWSAALRKLRPGQKITMGIRRGGNPLELQATVGEKQESYHRIVPIEGVDERVGRIRSGLLRTGK